MVKKLFLDSSDEEGPASMIEYASYGPSTAAAFARAFSGTEPQDNDSAISEETVEQSPVKKRTKMVKQFFLDSSAEEGPAPMIDDASYGPSTAAAFAQAFSGTEPQDYDSAISEVGWLQ